MATPSRRSPVISTSIGIEGLEIDNGKHALVADTPSAFAAHCIRLHDDADLREMLVQHGASLLREKYSPDRLKAILCSATKNYCSTQF